MHFCYNFVFSKVFAVSCQLRLKISSYKMSVESQYFRKYKRWKVQDYFLTRQLSCQWIWKWLSFHISFLHTVLVTEVLPTTFQVPTFTTKMGQRKLNLQNQTSKKRGEISLTKILEIRISPIPVHCQIQPAYVAMLQLFDMLVPFFMDNESLNNPVIHQPPVPQYSLLSGKRAH